MVVVLPYRRSVEGAANKVLPSAKAEAEAVVLEEQEQPALVGPEAMAVILPFKVLHKEIVQAGEAGEAVLVLPTQVLMPSMVAGVGRLALLPVLLEQPAGVHYSLPGVEVAAEAPMVIRLEELVVHGALILQAVEEQAARQTLEVLMEHLVITEPEMAAVVMEAVVEYIMAEMEVFLVEVVVAEAAMPEAERGAAQAPEAR